MSVCLRDCVHVYECTWWYPCPVYFDVNTIVRRCWMQHNQSRRKNYTNSNTLLFVSCGAEADRLIYSSVYGRPMQNALSSYQNTLNHTNLPRRRTNMMKWPKSTLSAFESFGSVKFRGKSQFHAYWIESSDVGYADNGSISNLTIRTKFLLNMFPPVPVPLAFVSQFA